VLEDLWLLCCREEMPPPPPPPPPSGEPDAAGEQQRGCWCWVRPQLIDDLSSSSSSPPSARAFHTATLVPGVGVLVFGECSLVCSRAPSTVVRRGLGRCVRRCVS
jgi:hypothetical protein